MLYFKWFFAICFITQVVKSEKICYLLSNKTQCITINFFGFIQVMTTQIKVEDVVYLELSNTPFEMIKQTTFNQFKNLETLLLANSRVQLIEDYAFHNFRKLEKIDLSNNYIETLRSDYFPPGLKELKISYNFLENLNEFNVKNFPNLTLLDVSYNKITYLPKDLIDHSIKIIASRNPMSCSFQNATAHILCVNQQKQDIKNQKIQTARDKEILRINKANCKRKCGFVGCVFWMIGAVWIGIIVGNVCKIKKMIFPKTKACLDKNTQYEKLDAIALVEIRSGLKQSISCKLEST